MNTLSLSSFGLEQSEQRAFEAVLTLSERALSASWRYQPNTKEADAVFVFLHSATGREVWQKLPPAAAAPIFVACAEQADTGAKWKLPLPPSGIPSRRALVELLNELAAYLAAAPATPVAQPLPTAAGENTARPSNNARLLLAVPETPPAFDPDRHFLGLLQKAIAAGRETVFALPGSQAWLLVSPSARTFHSNASASELQALLSAKATDIQRHDASGTELSDSAPPQALADLLWQAALAASHGLLPAGRATTDIVRLKHWPQIAHLPSYRQFLGVATFMAHHAATLDTIAASTATPIARVIDFHNACEALDLLERLDRADSVANERNGQARELSRKISNRLACFAINTSDNTTDTTVNTKVA